MVRRLAVVPPARVSGLALALLATACAGSSGAKREIFFPPPPQKARVQFIRSIQTEDDLNRSGFRKVMKAIVPHDTSNTIFGPTAIALSADETRVYVALPHRSRVVVIDLVAKKLSSVGTSADAPLSRPMGVAVDALGNLYVAERSSNSVVVFDAGGKLLRRFGMDKLQDPGAIAVDRKNQLAYVVSDAYVREGKHTVEVFSLAGKHLRTMGGGRSDAAGSFNFPHSVAVSRAGELYVADMLNFRVQVFDARGGLVRMFGQPGSGFPGHFDKIHSVSFDSFGNVYVADAMQGIHILNPEGQPLMLFGKPITQGATSLAIDAKNRIFVADIMHAVHEFQLVNTTAADSYPGRATSPAAPKAGATSPAASPKGAATTTPAPATTPAKPPPAAVTR